MDNTNYFEFVVTGLSEEDVKTLWDAIQLMASDVGGKVTGGFSNWKTPIGGISESVVDSKDEPK